MNDFGRENLQRISGSLPETTQLLTGTAGVSPAASPKGEQLVGIEVFQDRSRLTALVAGETPAVPVFAWSGAAYLPGTWTLLSADRSTILSGGNLLVGL